MLKRSLVHLCCKDYSYTVSRLFALSPCNNTYSMDIKSSETINLFIYLTQVIDYSKHFILLWL